MAKKTYIAPIYGAMVESERKRKRLQIILDKQWHNLLDIIEGDIPCDRTHPMS